MKAVSIICAASAWSLATAQLSYNPATNRYSCAQPKQAYCAGESLNTNIIVRCDASGVGQPGNCNNNVAGEPPLGNAPSPCWQTSDTSGDAACSKNCVVYGSSGNANGTFTLPADQCPLKPASSSLATSSATETMASGTPAVTPGYPSGPVTGPPATPTPTIVPPSVVTPSGNHTGTGVTPTLAPLPTAGAVSMRPGVAVGVVGLMLGAVMGGI